MRIIEIVTTLQERQNEAEGGVHFEGDSLTSAFRCGKALAYADAIDLLKNFPLMLSDDTFRDTLSRDWRGMTPPRGDALAGK